MDRVAGGPSTTSVKDRTALLQCYQYDSPQWEKWSTAVKSQLQHQPNLHTAILELGRSTAQHVASLPKVMPARVPRRHQDGKMWEHYRIMRGIRGNGIHCILKAWKHWTHFYKASRVFRREARQRKKALVDDCLSEAQECAIRRDTDGENTS